MSDTTKTIVMWALGGAALVGIPTTVAATSSTVNATGAGIFVAVGIFLVWTVALLLWMRPPDRRIARLLIALAVAYAVRGLAASDEALVFSVARALGQTAEFILVWVMLAFPSGRLRLRHDRIIVAAAAVVTTAVWIPTVLFSSAVPLAGPLVPCRASNCPRNALLVSDSPALASAFQSTFRWASAVILVAVAASLSDRLLHASPVTRRTLTPLFVVSMLRTLSIAVFVATNGSVLSGTVLIVLFWAVPVSMALGLVLGRLYTAAALLRLVSGLQRRPDADELRAVIADALEDPGLQIAYWLPDRSSWVDAAGTLSREPPAAGHGQATTVAHLSDGQPLAALVHDDALVEQPALVEAVTASTRMALESNRLRAQLALSDAKAADAQSRAREDLERDLHDGAQQRLIALRMKISVLNQLLRQDVRRAAQLAEELGPDTEAALDEIRDLARGRGARLLVDAGLEVALNDAADRAPVTTSVSAEHVGRYAHAIESAVYFTCLEALQNAAKHAPPESAVSIELADDGLALTFAVNNESLGQAITPDLAGHGLTNMRARMASCGGDLTIASGRDCGVTVRGRVPLT